MNQTIDVILPKLGFSADDALLCEWLAADGAAISTGQPLFTIESEKATQEIEAPATGRLRILKASGETYTVGTAVAQITPEA